jgi:hypothetical protein
MKISDNTKIKIRRQWNDWRITEIEYSKISDLHWNNTSGGVGAPAPQYFIHAYIWCNSYVGDLAHSCSHGEGPHRIKICITKTDNDPNVFKEIKSIVGEKPFYIAKRKHKSMRNNKVSRI